MNTITDRAWHEETDRAIIMLNRILSRLEKKEAERKRAHSYGQSKEEGK